MLLLERLPAPVQNGASRIGTPDGIAARNALYFYNQAGNVLREKTKSGTINGSAEFTVQMIPNLREAAEHSDMTEELAEILSTNKVDVRYEVKTGIEINGNRDD